MSYRWLHSYRSEDHFIRHYYSWTLKELKSEIRDQLLSTKRSVEPLLSLLCCCGCVDNQSVWMSATVVLNTIRLNTSCWQTLGATLLLIDWSLTSVIAVIAVQTKRVNSFEKCFQTVFRHQSIQTIVESNHWLTDHSMVRLRVKTIVLSCVGCDD
jgi:hypothetical protein